MFKLVLKSLNQVPFILLIFFMGFVQLAVAQNTPELSLEQASKQVLKSSKGKILSAQTTNYNGRKTHRIQILTSTGRVKIFQIPASKPRFKGSHYSNDRGNSNRGGNRNGNRNGANRYSPQPNNQHQNNHGAQNSNTRPKHQTTTSKDSKHK